MTAEDDVKDEQAAGRVALMLAKHPLKVLTAIASVAAFLGFSANKTDAFSPQEMRDLMRREIAPLRAGIEELAKGQSLKVQNNVLQAMLKAERRNAEAQ